MNGMKYRLIRAGRRKAHYEGGTTRRYFRLQAVRDIPEYGVKAGDYGGYITKEVHLSHYGACWIGGEAHVIGNVEVKDNAYINGRATVSCKMSKSEIVVSGNAKISHNAKVITYTTESGEDPDIITEIKGNAEITGYAQCRGVKEISGETKIYEKAIIETNCKIMGSSKLYNNATVGTDCVINNSIINEHAAIGSRCTLDQSLVSGNAVVSDQCILTKTELTGNAMVPMRERLTNGKVDKTGIKPVASGRSTAVTLSINPDDPFDMDIEVEDLPAFNEPDVTYAVSAIAKETLALLAEVRASIASYETDIVKLIKYPAMVDPSIPETLALVVALKKAVRLAGRPGSEDFREAVEDLEQKFILAESNAIKITATFLSAEEKKKTETAKSLLQVASDEGSTENEKKMAFQQGFKQLEGVIAVPESAVDAFRVKIGLQEIEA